MTLLMKDIIRENAENRLNLNKVSVMLEKIFPEIAATEATRITELFTELNEMVTNMNAVPYTKFNMMEWKIMVMATYSKVTELREEVLKLTEDEKVNVQPLIIALEEIFNK